MITQYHAALAALLYADIFDYPLTASEILMWSIKGKGIVPKEAKQRGGFLFVSGRNAVVDIRMDREQAATEKWTIARKAASFFRYIPTIQLVGVTGGLSMNNAKKDDDIDFFFIVSPNCLWITRFFAVLAMELLGKRRHRGETNVENTICLNMFMTEAHCAIPKKEHDLYVAHEVLQMKPLWERRNAYGKFLRANAWVKKFLPNAWNKNLKSQISNVKSQDLRFEDVVLSFAICVLRLFELPAKIIQLWYMKTHRTTEIIGDSVLRFHPKDARVWVKRALSIRLARYNIPLDNIFYDR